MNNIYLNKDGKAAKAANDSERAGTLCEVGKGKGRLAGTRCAVGKGRVRLAITQCAVGKGDER